MNLYSEIIEKTVEDFRKFIKKKGLKYTSKREKILKEILISKDHFDIDQLYIKLKKRGDKVSKASIYRTLPLLIEAGYIQEVYKQGAKSYYELALNKIPHVHFICIKCKKVDELIDDKLIQSIQNHSKKKNYTLLTYHLEVFGICEECKSKEIQNKF